MLKPSFNLRMIGPAFSEVQITSAKTKYLDPCQFADYVKLIKAGEGPIFIGIRLSYLHFWLRCGTIYKSPLCHSLWLHNHIPGVGGYVAVVELTQRRSPNYYNVVASTRFLTTNMIFDI